jgi:uncharacterized protein YyaL (SSP411 family)
MMSLIFKLLILFSLSAQGADVKWLPWSDSLFEKAKTDKKLVILDLQAVWCHWCHVMENETYKDATVNDLLSQHYIAIRVDQDSRPDIANRYEDYGWPATIIFSSEGKELVKRSGNIPPEKMAKLLEDVANNPEKVLDDDESSAKIADQKTAGDSKFSKDLEKDLNSTLQARYDEENGGWDIGHKFVDAKLIELFLLRGRSSHSGKEGEINLKKVKQTLNGGVNLLDPVWGGFYQYSTDANWKEPHFEKIMSVQTDMLKAYSLAYEQLGNKKYIEAAKEIHRYLRSFLRGKDGGFYTSQDADVIPGQPAEKFYDLSSVDRKKKGIPKVDHHRYARENGWVIQGLMALYGATGEDAILKEAIATADWIKKNRSLQGGGFSHDAKDVAGPYLSDTLSVARAFLDLYSATGNRGWLKDAQSSVLFMNTTFKNQQGDKIMGFNSAVSKSKFIPGSPEGDENIEVGRLCNLLFHYTGDKLFSGMAESAANFVSQPQMAQNIFFVSGILLLQDELSRPPIHVTVVGTKSDKVALSLVKAALKFPSTYMRLEWWDKSEGDLPHSDVTYPDLKTPAAFACSENRCGLPALKPEDVAKQITKVIGE